MRRTALVLIMAATLGTVLTGCGDDAKAVLLERSNQGQQAHDAVENAHGLDQQKADAVEGYLKE